MADLAASAVTIVDSWYPTTNKHIKSRRVTLVLTGQGTAANAIPASVMDFREIEQVTVLTQDDDTDLVVGAPDDAKTTLLLKAAATNAPADYTGTFKGVITGRPN